MTEQKSDREGGNHQSAEPRGETGAAFERVADAVFAIDADDRVTYANEAALSNYFDAVDDPVGAILWEESTRAADSRLADEVERARETQDVLTFTEFVSATGNWCESSVYPSETGVTVYCKDATERVELETDRDEKTQVLDRVSDVVWGVDTDWRLTYVNEAATRWADRPAEALLGERLWDVYPPVGDTTFREMAHRSMVDGEPGQSVEFWETNGIWVEVQAYPSETGMTLYARDVTEQKRLEAELDEIFDRVADGFYAIDEAWRVVYWNDELARRTNIPADDAIGTLITDIVPESLRGDIEHNFQRAFDTQRLATFETHVPELGFQVELTAYPSETGLSIYSKDVTERRRREQELRAAKARLDHALYGTETGIWEWDIGSGEVIWEGPTSRLFGLEPGEFGGTYEAFKRHVHPDDLEAVETAVEDAVGESKPYLLEHRVCWPDGTVRWVEGRGEPYEDESGEPIRMVGVVTDVTERKANEQALRESEARLRAVVENAPLVHFMLDRGGVVTLSEGRGLSTLGVESGENVGESAFDLYAEYPDVGEGLERALAGDPVHTVFEFDPATFEVWLDPIFDEDGDLTNVIGVANDITELRRKEDALTALNRSTRRLLAAETEAEVAEIVVDAGVEVLGLSSSMVLLFDDRESDLYPAAWAGTANEPVGHRYGPESPYWTQFVEEDTSGGDEDELTVLLGSHGLYVADATESVAQADDVAELTELLAATARATFDRVTREETLRHRERTLREQATRLEYLHEINEQIRNVEHVLVAAEERNEIERGVCERLIEPERFAFAWFGRMERGRMVATHWAGSERGYLPTIEDSVEETEPARLAAKTLEPVVVESVAEGLREASWRKEALACGYQSAMSVPLVYDNQAYGVLTVYATQGDAFDRMLQSVLTELGDTIAHAIDAVETKRGFLSDRVVELELRTARPADPLARIARRTGGTIRFDGIVPGEEYQRVFFTATDVDVETVVEVCERRSDVESISVLSAEEDGGSFEIVSSSSLFATALVDHGALPRRIESDEHETTAVVELAHQTDIGAFVRSLRRRFSDIELTARRDRDREPLTIGTLRSKFEAMVTPRQFEVLQTAYFCGYFESPRSMNGQEVAALLSISQPTFNYHLRAGERAVLSLLVGGGSR